MTKAEEKFYEKGSVSDEIDVAISFQIIGLFSEGLYSSPNKAIEELVSNAFDADASCVHTVMSPDRSGDDASIAILDNGSGMDAAGLKTHWIVGESAKLANRKTASGRRMIGKFGIGKLAAYVLGTRLTHISKSGGKFYSTTMDFTKVPTAPGKGGISSNAGTAQPTMKLPLFELTENQALEAVRQWMSDERGRDGLRLFGPEAEESWTVAIITDLKPMATELSSGRLRWVLSTAMPLRDDFSLYLNGRLVEASKADSAQVGRWTLGNEITDLPKPSPCELEQATDEKIPETDYRHYLLVDKTLGPISGYLELFEDPIDAGKSQEIGRSNGFFVYVHGRLINPDDAGFGIERNRLRHGTFSRFRLVVNIDRLDNELRSSREALLAGPAVERAKALLLGLFNLARKELEAHEAEVALERRATQRFADSPASLTEKPIMRLAVDAYEETIQSRHIAPVDKKVLRSIDEFQAHLLERVHSESGLIADVVYEDLGPILPMAMLDTVDGRLSINLEHPFVAHFADEFNDRKKNLPLELFALAEISLEASLNDAGLDPNGMALVLDSRDELLRYLAKSSGARNSITVAQSLLNSQTSARGLELALVDVFNQLGFDAVPKAAKDEQDGLAVAYLPASEAGPTQYRVSLEAKSKERLGAKVKKSGVEVSTIARHRDEANCDFALVVGPDFETGADDMGAVIREINADRVANPNKRITLMRASDLARLVRLAPVKRINLLKLRELFLQCVSPNEAAAWVDAVESSVPASSPIQQIIEAVFETQRDDHEGTVEYGALRQVLRLEKNLNITKEVLKDECRALSRMAPDMFFARDDRVELNTSPDVILSIIHSYVDELPTADLD
ncbi:ATP-binding protein [Timonella senegalensis]|uniref:ATP-binding protein n=3 Tax=Timonella senegalensis TaxID=1465825 RepID=UPI002FE4052B